VVLFAAGLSKRREELGIAVTTSDILGWTRICAIAAMDQGDATFVAVIKFGSSVTAPYPSFPYANRSIISANLPQ
jgi:hypothetical protein